MASAQRMMPGPDLRPISAGDTPGYGRRMVLTEPDPRPPLPAAVWSRLAGRMGPDLIDVTIAACCFVAFTVPVLLGATSARPSPAVAAFGVLAAAPLIVRRRWPVTVVLVLTVVYVVAALADVAFPP
jgi:hypothetical protein